MNRRHISEFYKTALANSGRAAGSGMAEDRYDDESGPGGLTRHQPAFIHREKHEDGEVVIIKTGRKEPT